MYLFKENHGKYSILAIKPDELRALKEAIDKVDSTSMSDKNIETIEALRISLTEVVDILGESVIVDFVPHATMLRINGKRFVCDCGVNVLTQKSPTIFVCNGCRTVYKSDDEDKKEDKND